MTTKRIPCKAHPDIRPDELTASEVAAVVRTQRQTVLKRHAAHPDKLPGRLLPFVPGLTASGRGIWAFKASGVALWQREKAEARRKAIKVRRLRAQGLWVQGRKG